MGDDAGGIPCWEARRLLVAVGGPEAERMEVGEAGRRGEDGGRERGVRDGVEGGLVGARDIGRSDEVKWSAGVPGSAS